MYLRTFSLVLVPVLLADCAHIFRVHSMDFRAKGRLLTVKRNKYVIIIITMIIIILVGGGSKIKASWRFLC